MEELADFRALPHDARRAELFERRLPALKARLAAEAAVAAGLGPDESFTVGNSFFAGFSPYDEHRIWLVRRYRGLPVRSGFDFGVLVVLREGERFADHVPALEPIVLAGTEPALVGDGLARRAEAACGFTPPVQILNTALVVRLVEQAPRLAWDVMVRWVCPHGEPLQELVVLDAADGSSTGRFDMPTWHCIRICTCVQDYKARDAAAAE